jgi:hypothetical protein
MVYLLYILYNQRKAATPCPPAVQIRHTYRKCYVAHVTLHALSFALPVEILVTSSRNPAPRRIPLFWPSEPKYLDLLLSSPQETKLLHLVFHDPTSFPNHHPPNNFTIHLTTFFSIFEQLGFLTPQASRYPVEILFTSSRKPIPRPPSLFVPKDQVTYPGFPHPNLFSDSPSIQQLSFRLLGYLVS